jgi:hypothetical protein
MNRISSAATKSLTVRYLIAIVAIGTTCVASQVLIQSMLNKAESQARMVDVAGRQRMLSQRIAKAVVCLASNINTTQSADLVAELETSGTTLLSVHNAMRFGDQSIGIPKLESDLAQAQLDSLDASLHSIVSATETVRVLSASNDLTSEDAVRLAGDIGKVEKDFVVGMDRVVTLIADHSMAQISWLFWAERLIMASTLMLLLLEALFVFRPTIKRTRDSIQGLRIALSQARSANLNAENAMTDRSTALSAAAIELKRLSAEIASLHNEQLATDPQPHVERFNIMLAHVRSTLCKLTDLADQKNCEEAPLFVSRTSPRNLVKDAIVRFREQMNEDVSVNVTMDDRLPASLLVDEQVFRDSIVHLLQSVSDSSGPNVSVHVGYDDREFSLRVVILGQGSSKSTRPQPFSSPMIAAPQMRRAEFDSLDLLIAKREVERLGGTIHSSNDQAGIAILIPLDETKQMNLFRDSDRLQIA